MYSIIETRGLGAWNAASSPSNVGRAIGYVLLSQAGFPTSQLRARTLMPGLLLVLGSVWLCCRSGQPSVRSVGMLTGMTWFVALVCQSAYALQVRHIVPLQRVYFDHLVPLGALAVAAGVLELRAWPRNGSALALLLVAAANLHRQPLADQISRAGAPVYRLAGCAVRVDPTRGSAVLFDSDLEAKLARLYHSDVLVQVVGWEHVNALSLSVERLRYFGSCSKPTPPDAIGWPIWAIDCCAREIGVFTASRARGIGTVSSTGQTVERPRGAPLRAPCCACDLL